MTPEERKQLGRANEELLRRRRELGHSQPRKIETPVSIIAAGDGRTEADYWLSVESYRNGGERPDTGGLTYRTSRAMLDSFDSDRHPDLQKAMRVVKCWFNHHLESGGGLILAGNYGCGKSHLARAIYEFYGYGAVYWNELDLVSQIQGGYAGHGRSQDEISTACRRARLLIYDDLGTYQTDNTPWLQNIYMRLFDGRQENNAAIMITTNLALTKTRRAFDEIRNEWTESSYSPIEDRLGGRLFSRVFGQLGSIEFYVNLFNVPDYRLRNL